MRRFALTAAMCLVTVLAVPVVFAQSETPQAAPATPTKYYKPIKGIAAIQIIPSASKKVGDDIVTTIKIKNMSTTGSIALLKVDEYWYKGKEVVTGDTQSWRKPFNPGEIIEITMKSPYKPGLTGSQYMYLARQRQDRCEGREEVRRRDDHQEEVAVALRALRVAALDRRPALPHDAQATYRLTTDLRAAYPPTSGILHSLPVNA